jgi:hypothetical protein
MQRDFDPIELLVLWWKAEREWSPVEGYPSECPSCRDYRTSRQHDDGNGAAETDARGVLIRHVGAVVARIDEPYKTALYMLARNHATGAQLWGSVRLPADQDERARIVSEAVERFSMEV